MGNLVLQSLEVQNFRGFRHLKIEHLGRVNLIVGKNNVGKSSLLEALRLYSIGISSQRDIPNLIRELLLARDEIALSRSEANIEAEEMLSSLKYMFYGRKDVREGVQPVRIGPMNSPDEILSIGIGWYVEQFDEDNGIKRIRLLPAEYGVVDNPVPRIEIQLGSQPKVNYPLKPNKLSGMESEDIQTAYISSSGFSNRDLRVLWDKVALTSYEKQVTEALRIITPGVEGVSMIGESRGLLPIVKITGVDERLPLRSLGDGMQRMLGIALALVSTKEGVLFIDEVDNGMHYSVQYEFWQFLFQVASRLNVQVFATTHRWDCIEGFQKAAQQNTQEEGMLIRLSVKNDEIAATVFDEEELGIITRDQIEVR